MSYDAGFNQKEFLTNEGTIITTSGKELKKTGITLTASPTRLFIIRKTIVIWNSAQRYLTTRFSKEKCSFQL
jgi:hypothetical protein